jgi:hypothetical protein
MDKAYLEIKKDEIIPEEYSSQFFAELFKNLRGDLEWSRTKSLNVSADNELEPKDNVTHVFITTGSGNVTVTIPLAKESLNRRICFIKVDAGGGSGIVDGNGAETINGAATQTLAAQYDGITIFCDGTEWFIEI